MNQSSDELLQQGEAGCGRRTRDCLVERDIADTCTDLSAEICDLGGDAFLCEDSCQRVIVIPE